MLTASESHLEEEASCCCQPKPNHARPHPSGPFQTRANDAYRIEQRPLAKTLNAVVSPCPASPRRTTPGLALAFLMRPTASPSTRRQMLEAVVSPCLALPRLTLAYLGSTHLTTPSSKALQAVFSPYPTLPTVSYQAVPNPTAPSQTEPKMLITSANTRFRRCWLLLSALGAPNPAMPYLGRPCHYSKAVFCMPRIIESFAIASRFSRRSASVSSLTLMFLSVFAATR